MLRVRLSDEPPDQICMESPYDRDFVERFKQAIPYEARRWVAERKRWVVSMLYATELVAFLQGIGAQLVDARTPDWQFGRAVVETAPGPTMPEDLRAAFDHLDLAYTAALDTAEAIYKFRAKRAHPDTGGNAATMRALNDAIHTIRHYLLEEDPPDVIPF